MNYNTDGKLVYIIIVNWQDKPSTVECLSSIKENIYPNYKIILVDNESNPQELNEIKELFVDLVVLANKENLGFTGGINQGITFALRNGADYILALNNDTIVEKDFVKKLVAAAEADNNLVVSPVILLYGKNNVHSLGGKFPKLLPLFIPLGRNRSFCKITSRGEICPDFLTWCCILVRAGIIRKVGILDNDFFAYGEEIEWGKRAKKLGVKVRIIKDSLIWHKRSRSTNSENERGHGPLKAYLIGRSTVIYGKKIDNLFLKIWWFVLLFALVNFLHVVFRCFSLKAKYYYIKGVIDGCRNVINTDICSRKG